MLFVLEKFCDYYEALTRLGLMTILIRFIIEQTCMHSVQSCMHMKTTRLVYCNAYNDFMYATHVRSIIDGIILTSDDKAYGDRVIDLTALLWTKTFPATISRLIKRNIMRFFHLHT